MNLLLWGGRKLLGAVGVVPDSGSCRGVAVGRPPGTKGGGHVGSAGGDPAEAQVIHHNASFKAIGASTIDPSTTFLGAASLMASVQPLSLSNI